MVFLFTAITLIYNFVCALMAVFVGEIDGNSTAAWFFAAIYAVLGIPGAWFLWCDSTHPPLAWPGGSLRASAVHHTRHRVPQRSSRRGRAGAPQSSPASAALPTARAHADDHHGPTAASAAV